MAVLSFAILYPLLQQQPLTEPDLIVQADDPVTVACLLKRQRELDQLQLTIDRTQTEHAKSIGCPRLGIELFNEQLVIVTTSSEVDALVSSGKLSIPDADWCKEELKKHLARYHAHAKLIGLSALRRRERRLGRVQDKALREYLVAPIRDASAVVVRLHLLISTLRRGTSAAALAAILRAAVSPRSDE